MMPDRIGASTGATVRSAPGLSTPDSLGFAGGVARIGGSTGAKVSSDIGFSEE